MDTWRLTCTVSVYEWPLEPYAVNTVKEPFVCTPASLWVRGWACARCQQNLLWGTEIIVIWFILSAIDTEKFDLFQQKMLGKLWYKSQYSHFQLRQASWAVLFIYFLLLLLEYRQDYVNHMKFFPCVHNKPVFKLRCALCQTSHTREWWKRTFSVPFPSLVLRFGKLVLIPFTFTVD